MKQAVRELRDADLGEKAQDALAAAERGELIVVSGQGEGKVAIVDLIDLRLLHAAVRYYVERPDIAPDGEDGPTDEAIAALSDPQDRFDLVMAHYLAQGLSLGRAGELLGLPWIDIRARLNRLGLPVWTGPETVEELRAEVEAVERWMAASRE